MMNEYPSWSVALQKYGKKLKTRFKIMRLVKSQ